jgi:adenosylcobinamide-GDP ribazoletransferase
MADRPKPKGLDWRGLQSAIQFLTILPCGPGQAFDARRALPFFPICGLLIGAIVFICHKTAGLFWPEPIVAMLDVVLLAALSGGLHLDGLADTADGLYGRREPQRALAIMKDSRIGAMGTLALLGCLALKWAGLAHSVQNDDVLWLVLIPAYARAAAIFGIKYLPYGRPGGGTGHAFFQEPVQVKDFWSMGILLLLSSFTGWGLVKLNLGFMGIVWLTLWWYRRKIQCITGDMLGALIEICETGLFLLAAASWGA